MNLDLSWCQIREMRLIWFTKQPRKSPLSPSTEYYSKAHLIHETESTDSRIHSDQTLSTFDAFIQKSGYCKACKSLPHKIVSLIRNRIPCPKLCQTCLFHVVETLLLSVTHTGRQIEDTPVVYLVNLLNVWCKQVSSPKQPELGHDSGSFCTLV